MAPCDLSHYAFRINIASCAAIGSCQKETQTWMVGVAKHGRFQHIDGAIRIRAAVAVVDQQTSGSLE